MLVVTNSIKIKPGFGQEIAQRFAEAKGVQEIEGFVRMEVWHEAKEGAEAEELKVSTVWEDEEAFKRWTSSESFRQSHGQGRNENILGASLNKYELFISHKK